MSFNEHAAKRIVEAFELRKINYSEKKMFGGVGFMVDDKMCLGILNDDLIVRMEPKEADKAQKENGCRPMDFSGKPLKGYLFVGPEAYLTSSQLNRWVNEALTFNPIAKKSKKKTKS